MPAARLEKALEFSSAKLSAGVSVVKSGKVCQTGVEQAGAVKNNGP
jgi:hypothetical protein